MEPEHKPHKSLTFHYGVAGAYVDVTPQVRSLCIDGVGTLRIPDTDSTRGEIFGVDPAVGRIKSLFISDNSHESPPSVTLHYAERLELQAQTPLSSALITNSNAERDDWWHSDARRLASIEYTQFNLMTHLNLLFGSRREEGPECRMSLQYVSPDSSGVLELGGNIGRNSCTLAQILYDTTKLVSLECDPESAAMLAINRDINQFAFNIEVAALSQHRLVQRGWNTRPLNPDEPTPAGWRPVGTITWPQLQQKYSNIQFDTLVADCEGALFYIVQDQPTFFSAFDTVMLENDYADPAHKVHVDELLRRSGLERVHSEALTGPWAAQMPCRGEFFEAWRRPATPPAPHTAA